jgi:hypothetical protein
MHQPRSGFLRGHGGTRGRGETDYRVPNSTRAAHDAVQLLSPAGNLHERQNRFKMEGRQRLYDCPSRPLEKRLGWSRWENVEAEMEFGFRTDLTQGQLDRCRAMCRTEGPKRDDVTVVQDPLPYMLRIHIATVFAPPTWPEQGLFCAACFCTNPTDQDRLYTKDSFLEHLKECRVRPDIGDAREARSPYLWLNESDESEVTVYPGATACCMVVHWPRLDDTIPDCSDEPFSAIQACSTPRCIMVSIDRPT